jgi:hypothetical protein
MRARPARPLVAAACLAAVCSAVSCGSEPGSDDDPPTRRIDVVVGDIVRLTGPSAGLGAGARKAAQLAVEEINDAIGEVDAEHTVEIVHQDETAGGPRAATRALLDSGATCILGPWSRRGLARVAQEPEVQRGGLLISPRVPVARMPGVPPESIKGLPLATPQVRLSLQTEEVDRDPLAAFARLYVSTDPPLGRARTSDARQFDAVILCYLASVAAGSPDGPTYRIGPPTRRTRAYTWLQLTDAIEVLGRGRRITYAGITVNAGIHPAPGGIG